MAVSVDDPQIKALMTEIFVELLQQRRDIFYEIVVEALEEVGLGKAIEAGLEDEAWVDEAEIRQILQGES